MASAFADRRQGGFILSFRAPGQHGTDRTRKRAPKEIATKAAADRLARRIDDACRAVEAAGDPLAVAFLVEHGVLRPDDARAVSRGHLPALRPAPRRPSDITIEEAALAHPAVQREKLGSPVEHERHLRELRRFSEWSRVWHLSGLSLQLVLDWVATLRARGAAPDTRRHHLMYLRCACAMAPAWAMPDPLAGHRIDRRTVAETRRPRAYSETDLVAVLKGLEPGPDPRPLVAVALMACCGLRPESDLLRLQCGDLAGGVLHVGVREAKTLASRRSLPLPGIVAEWSARLLVDAKGARCPGDWALLRSRYRSKVRRDRALDRHRLGELLRTAITGLADDHGRPILQPADYLPGKYWRKTFATLARDAWGIDRDVRETYLGHTDDTTSGRHYEAAVPMDRLRAAADAIDARLRARLSTA